MAIRTLAEFTEALKADRRALGYDDSLITEEEPTTDPSGTRTYSVVFVPRRPTKPVNPQGETDE